MKQPLKWHLFLGAALWPIFFASCLIAEEVDSRVKWTTSRVLGSPDPPLPYATKRVFPNLKLKSPIYVAPEPQTNALIVIERVDGGSRFIRFENNEKTDSSTDWLNLPRRQVYALTFDDDYKSNRFVYVFCNGRDRNRRKKFNRISRYTVSREEPFAVESESRHDIIEWDSGGHDGGDLAFGNDGMLYITAGDGTADSDKLVSGQDVTNLLASLIRIDVSGSTEAEPYRVPDDNPFADVEGARPEIWAFGFRNPWRMSIDRTSGQIWVGNNGQDLWETAYLVRRGDNFGWSVYEGNHPFYLNRRLGPAPFTPATVEHHHREARSLTGGVVYRGSRLPELDGVYIYGDYSTGKIWGVRHDGEQITWHQELADTTIQIVAFRVDQHERLLVVDHVGSISEIIPNRIETDPPPFPQRLSETGLFESVPSFRLEKGVVPYSVNAPMWADGAQIARHLAVPGDSQIGYSSSGAWDLPEGSVVLQTFSMELELGNASTRRRIESRLLTKQQNEWLGYSYRWNDAQTDAFLVRADGDNIDIKITDPASNQSTTQKWSFPSRAECMVCHSRAANYLLGVSGLQMNRNIAVENSLVNQAAHFHSLGLLKGDKPKSDSTNKLANPYNEIEPLTLRARSYLHANCSSCHTDAGGGNSQIELTFRTDPKRMKLIYHRPLHKSFSLENAMLVAPGEPERSVLLHRLSNRGAGQMPPLVLNRVDTAGVELMTDWVRSLQQTRKFVKDWKIADFEDDLAEVAETHSSMNGEIVFADAGCLHCHRVDGKGGGTGPNFTSIQKGLTAAELLESIIAPSKQISKEFANVEILTSDGLIHVGRVESEDSESLTLRSTADPSKTITIDTANIEERGLSKISNMPTGTINTFTKEQTLDLIAYLLSKVESKNTDESSSDR